MKKAWLGPKIEAELWLHIFNPNEELTPRVARVILKLSFPQDNVARMRELSAKARAGMLTPEEDAEMDSFERVGSTFSILKSKARQAQSACP